MWEQIFTYFQTSAHRWLTMLSDHVRISAFSLLIAALIAVPAGLICVRFSRIEKVVRGLFNLLRLVPSLAVLLLILPVMGTGSAPATVALVLLAIPPILMNTVAGLEGVPPFMLETAEGLGMEQTQVWVKVRFPLAAPLILAGIKTAAVEIVASATLAAKIGAGGMGELIFTGIGLFRMDLLLIGGISIALLSLITSFLFDLLETMLIKYNKGDLPMKRKKAAAALLAAVLLSVNLLSLPGCTQSEDTAIRIGSKDFTESLIVSEIYALALEDAGYQVERKMDIAGSIIHTAITGDEIDLYPEYTGTALLSILKLEMNSDPDIVYNTVKDAYNEQFQITWLDSTQINDTQGITIRTETAKQYGIYTISDLQANADKIRVCSQGEFEYRDDGLSGLSKVYGPFNFQSITVYDNGLKYQILENNEADVCPGYSTDAQLINTDKLTYLEDDKHFWPPYYLAPIVRNNILEENPGIAKVLNQVSAKLDTETVISLNAKVDIDNQEYEEVAKEFYDSINQ